MSDVEAGRTADLGEVIKDVLKVVSHDLRQPLMVIQGYLSLIGDGVMGDLPAETAALIPDLLDRVDEVNALIDSVVLCARLETGVLLDQPLECELRQIVETALATAGPASGGPQVTLDLPEDALVVLVDPGHASRALTNLISNAIRFSPGRGDLRVTVRRAEDAAVVDVADQGVGIADSDRDRLFTRFGRVHGPATRGLVGVGLGLVVARGLARLSGGDVVLASSEPGHGSVFRLRLPLAG